MSNRSLSGNAAVLKKINRARLLNHLWHSKGASRLQLAEATGLDGKTITNICNSLFEDRLIIINDAPFSGMGRPPQRVELNKSAAFSIGADVGGGHVTAVLLDLQGEVRDSVSVFFGDNRDKPVLEIINDSILKLIDRLEGDASGIRGMGVCVPGLIDYAERKIVKSVNVAELENCSIAEYFEERFDMPVFLEEASRSMAVAEIWFGGRYGQSDFIVVDLGVGIGLGIVHNGALYRGAHGNSGEIGHLVVQPGGSLCRCGKTGCLETVASGRAFDNAAADFNFQDPGKFTRDGTGLYNAAVNGDGEAGRIFEEAGTSIGTALANVVNILDPKEIILQGGLVNAGDILLEPMKQAVARHALGGANEPPAIVVSRLGSSAGAAGAAMLPLKQYFEIENIRFY